MKIVSGGQTGVDRAALDAALESGVDAGGWCPQGRLSEDGVIPAKYPVIELSNSDYQQRTKQNVIDSDGTAIIYFRHPTGGTKQTIHFCIEEKKPYVLVDAEDMATDKAAAKISRFISEKSVFVLNVAGPRISGEARGYEYAKEVIKKVLSDATQYAQAHPDAGCF